MTEVQQCKACGRSYGEGEGEFCRSGCRQAFDSGFPAYDSHEVRRLTEVSLRNWAVVAGPPGVEIGSNPWAAVIAASDAQRAGRNGGLIRPRRFCARCGAALPVWVDGQPVKSSRTRCFDCSPPKEKTKTNKTGH